MTDEVITACCIRRRTNPSTSTSSATWNGDLECIADWIDQEVALDLVSKHGYTPLYHAVVAMDADATKLILDKGHKVHVDFCLEDGITALHMAAKQGDPDCLRLLLNAGADPELRTKDMLVSLGVSSVCEAGGRTALHWAANARSMECCKILLEFEAEKEVWDGDGNTPSKLALLANHHELAVLLHSPTFGPEPPNPKTKDEIRKLNQTLYSQRQTRVTRMKRVDRERQTREAVSRIRREYTPLHPQVYDLDEQLMFEPDFLKAVQSGDEASLSSLLVELAPKIFGIKIFRTEYCMQLMEELDHFNEMAQQKQFAVARPNSMNNYGVVLNGIGFAPLFQRIMTEMIAPISALKFGTSSAFKSNHTFMIKYKVGEDVDLKPHMDNSDVTLNVCIGKCGFAGGNVYFHGVGGRCDVEDNPADFVYPHPEGCDRCILKYDHCIGHGLIHRGQQIHGADKLQSGERCNLIMWMRYDY